MKTRRFVLLIAVVMLFGSAAMAQKGNKKAKGEKAFELNAVKTKPMPEPEPEPEPEELPVTEECTMNLSLFDVAAKQKNYADAYEPWKQVYDNCPTAHRAIYTRGEKIMDWKMSVDASEETFALYMEMYDKWMKYFGKDASYPRGKVLGRKAITYIKYKEANKVDTYEWLKKSVALQKNASEVKALQQFVYVSYERYKQDAGKAEDFINDYLTVSEILEANAKNAELKDAAKYAEVKPSLDELFARSGAADCAALDNIFAAKVEANQTDVDYLNMVLSLYRRRDCEESAVFFKASEYAHKIKPTVESANGCAQMSIKNENYEDAIRYYEDAIGMCDDATDKASYLFKVAQIYSKLNKYSKARDYARQAIAANPNWGKPYMLIGSLYANSGKLVYPDDPFLQKTVFWVAVDKFEQAKRVDPSCADDANKMISSYRKYFPTTEDAFMHGLTAGAKFTVEGWIGETTTCR